MMKRLSVFLLAQSIVFASPFEFEAFRSETINVYSMGYRLSNRIYQREKLKTQKICSKITMDYGLTSRSLLLDHKFHMNVAFSGIKVGGGKRSTIDFKCSISIQNGNSPLLLESNDLDFRLCAAAKEDYQQGEDRLIISDHRNNKCSIYAL